MGEESYNKELDRHLNKMGKDDWELVSVEKSVKVLAISRELTSKMKDEQLENHISPREVFVFFWKKPRESALD